MKAIARLVVLLFLCGGRVALGSNPDVVYIDHGLVGYCSSPEVKNAAVKFSLIDMQGRVVRTFDLDHRAAGVHFETRSVENLPYGRYIGVLQVGGKATEKVMLLKR